MNDFKNYIVKGGKKLVLGYTTGLCAAGASAAAAQMLLTNKRTEQVKILSNNGLEFELEIEKIVFSENSVSCAVRKFSGDDPDITNGIYIYSEVFKAKAGITILGGKGVGKVTKEGLSCLVGEPAINPVPLKMIKTELNKIAKKANYAGGLKAIISAPEGEVLAKKTYNPRLGIVGGISILGTTGVVEPMSNQAIVETFKLEMNAAKAEGRKNLVLVPGNYGRNFAKAHFGIDFEKAIKISNFLGEALDYARFLDFEKLVIIGHCGKLVKLAAGIMNTHSNMADARMEIIAAHAGTVTNLYSEKIQLLLDCNTVDSANALLKSWGILEPTWESIGKKIAFHLSNRLGEGKNFSFAVLGGDGLLVQSGEIES